jgi:hypothetical protein
MSSEQFELGGIVADLAADQAKKNAEEHEEQIARHIESMASCWSEWDGNDGIKVGTRVEVHGCIARLETPRSVHEGGDVVEQAYFYTAPCVIAEVVSDREWIAVVDYTPDTVAHCLAQNGIRLRLGILDIWPPVRTLAAARRAEADAEKLEAEKIMLTCRHS